MAATGATCCSFLGTTFPSDVPKLDAANEFMRLRGPDGTRCVTLRGVTLCHNLLHMTGDLAAQPFVDDIAGIVVAYNGEIYNYKALGQFLGMGGLSSDGEVVLPMYAKYGVAFPRLLDGEFAIVVFDLAAGRALLAVDAFSTKPLWYSRHGGLRVATYRSAVERLGAPAETIKMLDPNTVLVVGLTTALDAQVCPVLARFTVYEFDMRQFKTDVTDFLQAFLQAVAKRMRSNHPVFIGLSSGYDSGAIQVALKIADQAHAAYTIFSTEDIDTVERRLEWTGDLVDSNIIILSEGDRKREEAFLRQKCEHFLFSGLGRQGALADDPASHGLSYIFRDVRQRGLLVYLSGTGADEIISDYGFNGKKHFPHSSFGGLFPSDLNEVFPWPSFFVGTQRDYLMKEELVAGAHGLEGRYPFLDRSLVQEYLWLASSAKNYRYKAPLHTLMDGLGYPFRPGEKLGFNADWNLKEGGESIVINRGTPRLPREAAGSPQKIAKDAEVEDDGIALPLAESIDEVALRNAFVEEAEVVYEQERKSLIRREAVIATEYQAFDEERLQRIQMYLFVMAPRLAEIRHTASGFARPGLGGDPGTPLRPVHPRWLAVEVVTCVSGGLHAMVADFPVYEIFRYTTPLPVVHNICENIEWEGMHFRLRAYARFFQELERPPAGTLPTLYYVSDGLDVFFNDLSEVAANIHREGVHHGASQGHEDDVPATLARITASIIIERYDAISGGVDGQGPWKPIVASSERLCGWGGAKLCSDEDERRYPDSPTDSKYLNAGGYLGPADAISTMITAVLELKENARGDVREKGRDSDQYFFKRYFWEHQDMIALDYNQSIFGNFLEVVNRPCENDWVPQCAKRPCCTESDNFRHFHKLFYGRYQVRGCAVWRDGNLPVSWHGNGAGKWLYLLALNRLALQCAAPANLTLARFPADMLEGVFEKFERRVATMTVDWPSGFVMLEAATPSEAGVL